MRMIMKKGNWIMARKIINTKDISHEEWLELRKKSIGGSDAGAVMGMNPWKGPVGLYADKMGLIPDKETTEAMRLGIDLESYVSSRFVQDTGKKIRRDNYMYAHDDYDFITANIDRVVVGENAGLECKTMSGFNNYDLENRDVPAQYYAQCQHYMLVMGYDRMYLTILVFQKGVYVVPIERNDSFIKELLEKEVHFWTTYIEKQVMPAPTTEEDRESVKQLYPKERDNLPEIYLRSLDRIVDMIHEHDEAMKMHKAKSDELKAQVQMMMGEYGRGYGDKYKVSWLAQERRSVDAKKLKEQFPQIYAKYEKVSTSRPLRISKIK